MAWLERRGGVYQICWRDASGKKQRKTTGQTDKSNAKIAIGDLNRDMKARRVGAVDPFKAHNARPLTEHIADWLATLDQTGVIVQDIAQYKTRMTRLAAACEWRRLADITAESFEKWRQNPLNLWYQKAKDVTERKDVKLASRTVNHYYDALRAFCNWAVKRGRMVKNPIEVIGKVDQAGDERRKRRALTGEEIGILLEAVKNDGHRLAYRLSILTGLRRGELQALVWGDVRLSAVNPFLALRAEATKNGKAADLPLRSDLAEELRKARGDNAFDVAVCPDVPTLKQHKRYLKAAGIPYMDEQGRQADWHALRGTLASLLARSNAPVKVTMDLLRHSDPRLTLKTYANLRLSDLAGAMENVPTFTTTAEPHILAATGTTDTVETAVDPACQNTANEWGANQGARSAVDSHKSQQAGDSGEVVKGENHTVTSAGSNTLSQAVTGNDKSRRRDLNP